MTTIRTRIVRLSAASLLGLSVGALGAGPASASYSSWAGSAPPESYDFTAETTPAQTAGPGPASPSPPRSSATRPSN